MRRLTYRSKQLSSSKSKTTTWRVVLGVTVILSAAVGAAAGPPTTAAPARTNFAASAPYAGNVNYAHTSPAFRWGWFGAEHFYPNVHWHRDYNGDVIRWSNQRRY